MKLKLRHPKDKTDTASGTLAALQPLANIDKAGERSAMVGDEETIREIGPLSSLTHFAWHDPRTI